MTNKKNIQLGEADKEMLVFFDSLLEKKGMKNLPANILSDMAMDLYLRFEKFLLLSIMESVSEEEYEKINIFLETNPSQEESQKFLQENINNLEEIVEKAMLDFEKVYLEEGKKQEAS